MMTKIEQVQPVKDGFRPFVMWRNGRPICLVYADEFLLSYEVVEEYCKHTGFDRKEITWSDFGHNILKMERTVSKYEEYRKFYQEYKHLHLEDKFVPKLAELFNITIGAAYEIVYATRQSWFVPEMVEELIRLDKFPRGEFQPNIYACDFKWEEGKFKPL